MPNGKSVLREPYRVMSVERTEPPSGIEGGDWYRYEVRSGRSTVTGYSQGSQREVSSRAQLLADDLNSRADGRSVAGWTQRRGK